MRFVFYRAIFAFFKMCIRILKLKKFNLQSVFCLIFSLHTGRHVFRGTRPRKSVNKTTVSIRVWAWFSSDGAGSIALLDYLSDNQFEELIPQAVARFGTGPVRSISDNESRVPFETLNALAISYEELRWPPKSRHLSPFVTIWSLIEQGIRLQRGQPRNAAELWDYVSLMWERHSEQPLFWIGLTASLQEKLRSIVTAGGRRRITEAEKK